MQQSDVYYQHCLNMFRATLCPSSEEQRPCVTACGVLRWFCWMWLVAAVGRCVVRPALRQLEHHASWMADLFELPNSFYVLIHLRARVINLYP